SQICQNSSLPVVAIGGIDEAVIKDLRGIKLGGVAVVRAIMNAKNPYQATKTLKKAVCENLSLK
ncbi:thiamine phosphate synthase, partial [Campylobacter jejuni]